MAPHLIKFPAGSGKTVSVLEGIASSGHLPWEIYVPTHALAEECKQTLLRLNPALRVAAIKGRDHPLGEVSKMCKKHLQASALTKAGLSVFEIVYNEMRGNPREKNHLQSSVILMSNARTSRNLPQPTFTSTPTPTSPWSDTSWKSASHMAS